VRWYRKGHRDLPWRRHEHDPYATWVSEIMLQQTRAAVVAPRFERFLARFPTVEALAAVPPQAVIAEWAGLGYYARARNLHQAARIVVREHGGVVPRHALQELPGIGRYTAGAIRSIAWGDPEPILDGNVARVFARLFGVEDDSKSARDRLWELATAWAQGPDPGAANQALMELGATVCVKPQPACEPCPLEAHCFARRHRRERELPAPRRRAPVRRLAIAAFIVVAADTKRILLVRRRSGDLLRDFWDLPALAASAGDDAAATAGERLALGLAPPRPLGRVRHAILAHAIDATIHATHAVAAGRPHVRRGPANTPRIASLDAAEFESRWVTPAECRRLPLSTLAVKALAAAAKREPHWQAYRPRTA